MSTIFCVGIMAFLWIVNLFTGTGLDSVYHVTEYTKYAVLILCALLLITRRGNLRGDRTYRRGTAAAVIMIITFVVSTLLAGNGLQAFDYLWVFGVVYLLSMIGYDDRVIRWTGIVYGAAGIVILYMYNYSTVFSGWNENSIAMLGLYSYLVLLIALFDKSVRKNKLIVMAATVVYIVLIWVTNSRSGILFLVIGALLALNLLPRRPVYEYKSVIFLLLNVPLIVAIVTVVISRLDIVHSLNDWSLRQFGKPIFNGRDDLWNQGLGIFWENLFIGTGNLNIRTWHNSAVTCLTAYGLFGYCSWLMTFKGIIDKADGYTDDPFVQGCIVSFLVIFAQQSVELGLIATTPSLIAYVILGLLLGRIRYSSGLAEEMMNED